MSVQNPSTTTTASTDSDCTCGHCGGVFDPVTAVDDAYCSTECHRTASRASKASEILELLQNDHRFCYSCFSQLKDVHKPAKSVVVGAPDIGGDVEWSTAAHDVLVGLQTRLEPAEIGEKTRRTLTSTDAARKGTICTCGNTDHRHREPTIQRLLGLAVADRLIEAVETLQDEEMIETEIDERQLREIVDGQPPVVDPVRFALTEAVILE